MRNTFINTLCELTENNKDIIFISGDLGYGYFNKYWKTYPDNFINIGISEQNMTSVAAGMALEGKIVFTYSLASFPTIRCLEQIRTDVAYHQANVKIVATGAGFSYGGTGMSHHATEDIAATRVMPHLTIFSPGDPVEAREVVKAAAQINGPCYLRLGRGEESIIHKEGIKEFKVGKAIELHKGTEICLFATGAILSEAYEAMLQLNEEGISTSLYSFPTIKPIDKETIIECAKKHHCIITIEEHNCMGGFGSAVAEVLATIKGPHAFQRYIGLQDTFTNVIGDQTYLRQYYQMDKESIIKLAKESRV